MSLTNHATGAVAPEVLTLMDTDISNFVYLSEKRRDFRSDKSDHHVIIIQPELLSSVSRLCNEWFEWDVFFVTKMEMYIVNT